MVEPVRTFYTSSRRPSGPLPVAARLAAKPSARRSGDGPRHRDRLGRTEESPARAMAGGTTIRKSCGRDRDRPVPPAGISGSRMASTIPSPSTQAEPTRNLPSWSRSFSRGVLHLDQEGRTRVHEVWVDGDGMAYGSRGLESSIS